MATDPYTIMALFIDGIILGLGIAVGLILLDKLWDWLGVGWGKK